MTRWVDGDALHLPAHHQPELAYPTPAATTASPSTPAPIRPHRAGHRARRAEADQWGEVDREIRTGVDPDSRAPRGVRVTSNTPLHHAPTAICSETDATKPTVTEGIFKGPPWLWSPSRVANADSVTRMGRCAWLDGTTASPGSMQRATRAAHRGRLGRWTTGWAVS